MADRSLEHVFNRVFTYLVESGLEMNPEQSQTMLQLISDVVADGVEVGSLSETQLLQRAMDRLPDYFPLCDERLPAPSPALIRGSIGYLRRG